MKKVGFFRLVLFASEDYIAKHGMPESREALPTHTFVDYVEDLVAIQPVHWLLDVLDPVSVAFRSSSMHAQQNAVASGVGIGLLPLFSAKKNPILVPILADEVQVFRDVFLSVHEDLEFLARVRIVTKHIVSFFKREAGLEVETFDERQVAALNQAKTAVSTGHGAIDRCWRKTAIRSTQIPCSVPSIP